MLKYNITCEYEIITEVWQPLVKLMFSCYKREYKTFADEIARSACEHLYYISRDLAVKNSMHFLDEDGDQLIMRFDATIEAPDSVTEEQLRATMLGFSRAHWFNATAEELEVNWVDFADGEVILKSEPLTVSIRKTTES